MLVLFFFRILGKARFLRLKSLNVAKGFGVVMNQSYHSLLHLFLTSNAMVLYTEQLTHYQTTNFRLFQTERVCRRQFQISRKWKKVIQMDRKHCGKRSNCSLRAISPFPTVFSKRFFPRGVKRCHCVGLV